MLQALVNDRSTDYAPKLQSEAYRAHQLILALRLPPDVRSAVATAYSWTQVPDAQAYAKVLDARDETEAGVRRSGGMSVRRAGPCGLRKTPQNEKSRPLWGPNLCFKRPTKKPRRSTRLTDA